MKLRSLLAAAAIALAPAVLLPAPAMAEPPIYTGAFDDLAVQGYDPVAYFTDGKPVKGDKAFSTEYMGATFRFASNAPFRGEPANVPVILERTTTDNVFPNNDGNNEPPPEGGA